MGILEAAASLYNELYPALKQSTDYVTWKMPKWGSSRADCGEIIYAVTCEDKHTPVIHGIHCYRPECPECYEYWANREGKSATERIEVVEKLYAEAGKRIGKPKHVIFSPPQDWAIEMMETLDGFKKLRSKCNKITKDAGFLGGCLIFHSHRQKHADTGSNCDSENCQKEHIWELSPHFHSIGYGFLEKSDTFYEKTEWIYKNKGVRKTVFGTIKYLLTHCGLCYVNDARKTRATTWYGILGCNQLMIVSTEVLKEPQYCDTCGGHLIKWFVAGDDEHLIPAEEYLKKTRIRTYKLRKLPYTQSMINDDFG